MTARGRARTNENSDEIDRSRINPAPREDCSTCGRTDTVFWGYDYSDGTEFWYCNGCGSNRSIQ